MINLLHYIKRVRTEKVAMMKKKNILSLFLASVMVLGAANTSYIQANTISEELIIENEEWKDPYQYGGETGLKEQKVDTDEISTMYSSYSWSGYIFLHCFKKSRCKIL